MIQFDITKSITQLNAIIELQKRNLKLNLDSTEIQSQGFVTVQHDLSILEEMHEASPHIIALNDSDVVGYALVMLNTFSDRIPILKATFEKINLLEFKGILLQQSKYFLMGQVCIDKPYRGQGLFAGLYTKMKEVMAANFDYIITEVALENKRSMRAHEKVGFEVIHTYHHDNNEWAIILWDWNSKKQ